MANLHDAVRAIYSNAINITGNNVDSLIVKDVNEQPITIVPATVTAKLAELQTAEEQAKQDAENHKASALAKLTALGLTADEVKALIG